MKVDVRETFTKDQKFARKELTELKMTVGIKQHSLIIEIRSKGKINSEYIEELYNLKTEEEIFAKTKELCRTGWLKKHPKPNSNLYIIGPRLPYIEEVREEVEETPMHSFEDYD